jgi:hypothetical protein
MVPEDIVKPPDLYPLTIEWPDEFYQRSEESIVIDRGTVRAPFFDVGIDLIDPAPGQQMVFCLYRRILCFLSTEIYRDERCLCS